MSLFTATRPLDFNAATNATSGQTQNVSMGSSTLPTFGKKYDFNSVANEPLVWSRDVNVLDSSILGYPRGPAFGVSSNSHYGTPRLDSYSSGQPAVSMSGSKGKESTPFFKSSGFGKSTFGINQKGSRTASYTATPDNDITGTRIQSICGMPTYKDKSQEELRFEDYQLGDKGTLAFNAATNAISGLSQNIYPGSSTSQTFGKKYDVNSVANEPLLWPRDSNVPDFCAFGPLKASSFGVSSNSYFGTPSFNSYSFGQPAVSMSGIKGKESSLLQSSGYGKSAFGINQKGSRIASYIATPDIDNIFLDGGGIQSICGMQTYQHKSQEELRFEDYQLGDKGQKCGSSFGVSGTQGFGVIDKTRPFISSVFNQSTVNQPVYSHFPSTFAVERAGIDSLSNENSTPFSKPQQQSISHIFPPNTSLLNSCGTGSRVQSTASNVSFSPWIHSSPFAPFNPASSSSTTSTFSPSRNPWSLSTSTPLSPCSVSPSTYPLLAKPSGPDFDQKNYFPPTPVLTTGGAPQSTFCLNCLKQSQPTPPGLSNVSSTPLATSQNTPLFSVPLQPEMTPKVGATLPTTKSSHPLTGASCSEIGQGVGQQPSVNGQQSYFPRIMEVKPSPIMPPAETQPSVQISVEHPYLETSIQYGISSLPVSNNPAPLIIRHSSLTQHRLPPQEYKPTSDKPKILFVMDKENASGVLRTEVIIIPRDRVRPTAESPLGADSSMDRMHDGDKVGDKPKLEPEEMHHDNCGDDKDVDGIMPKLQRADYYTVPPMEELLSKEKEEADFCCHVKDFVVGRHGYGSIKFLGETDVRKLDLDSAVQFNHREVVIYMDESKKPPVGQGINKPAEITLLNVRCINKSTGKEYRDGPMVNKYRDMLIKKAVELDAEFVSYDPVEGQWKFRVSHL